MQYLCEFHSRVSSHRYCSTVLKLASEYGRCIISGSLSQCSYLLNEKFGIISVAAVYCKHCHKFTVKKLI